MKIKLRRVLPLSLVIIVGLIVLFVLFWPLSDYIEGPGDANNLNSMVTVDHHLSRYSGKLMLTSVGIAQAHPVSYCWARLNPEYSIESAKNVTGDQNDRVYNRVQKFYMKSAIQNAVYVAYRRAHRFVKRRYRGIYVVDVMARSHFKPALKVGDIITRINHRHFNSAEGYQRYLSRLDHHSRVTIQYVHQGVQHHVTSRLIRLPGEQRWGLGVVLTDDSTVRTKVPFKVNSGQIGGPSGGLMFTLQMYSQLKPVNLTKGRKIAGTGMIDSYGNVGEIGGIDKKIIAAKRRGATIFLAPYVKPTWSVRRYEPDHLTNYQLAKRTVRKYHLHMKIIPVRTFRQAVKDLKRTPN